MKLARDALAEVTHQAATDMFVPRKAVTVEGLYEDWLASPHNACATTVNGYAYCLAPLRERFGHLPVQRLTRPDLDKLLIELRDGGTETAGAVVTSVVTLRLLSNRMRRGRLAKAQMKRHFGLCPRQDSNLRPSAPEADALSPELRGRMTERMRRWACTA